MLSYLRQHFDIIQMYVTWIKPYLRHVGRLSLKEKSMDSADIVSAFEGSMLDIELLARKSSSGANGCVLATYNYRTRPELKVVQEGYQRGPVHIGRFEVTTRVYVWTDQQVEMYRKLKKEEALWLLSDVSESIKKAMESLGTELFTYYRESTGESAEEKKEHKTLTAKKTVMEKLFGDFYTPKAKKGQQPSAKELKEKEAKREAAMEGLLFHAQLHAYTAVYTFKKAHKMIAW